MHSLLTRKNWLVIFCLVTSQNGDEDDEVAKPGHRRPFCAMKLSQWLTKSRAGFSPVLFVVARQLLFICLLSTWLMVSSITSSLCTTPRHSLQHAHEPNINSNSFVLSRSSIHYYRVQFLSNPSNKPPSWKPHCSWKTLEIRKKKVVGKYGK